MVQRVATVAFEGIEARAVDVQVQVAPGLPAFNVVGLPDKAVSEARERVRAALVASGLALPARRITVNLAPADVPKEGSHYDLPIALGLMAAIGAIPADALSGFTVLGELGLDGSIAAVAGVLPAAIGANGRGEGLICPAACGAEAAWASPEMEIVAAASLIQLANHFRGTQVLARPQPKIREVDGTLVDLKDIKGQESAARLPTILPPLTPAELLEVSMIASVAGEIEGGALTNRRPFRAPHHSASMPALVGGGLRAAGRNLARASRRPLPRRVARVPAAGARFAASAARDRGGRDRASEPSRDLSRAFHVGCRHEPLPLRPRQRAGICLQARRERALRRRVSGAAVGPAHRPHRLAHRGAGGDRRRSHPAAAGGRKPRGGRARRARPRDAGGALRRGRPAAGAHQRGRARAAARRGGSAGRGRARAPARRRRCHAALGARLSSRAAGGAHARRSRRRRPSRPRAFRRGAVLPRARRRGAPRGVSARAAYSRRSATSSTRWLSTFLRMRSARWRVGKMFSRRLRRLMRVQIEVAVLTASASDKVA